MFHALRRVGSVSRLPRPSLKPRFRRRAGSKLRPMTITVLDAGGDLVAFKREDGNGIRRFDVVTAKAVGSLVMNRPKPCNRPDWQGRSNVYPIDRGCTPGPAHFVAGRVC